MSHDKLHVVVVVRLDILDMFYLSRYKKNYFHESSMKMIHSVFRIWGTKEVLDEVDVFLE